jgi:hypothetical protein
MCHDFYQYLPATYFTLQKSQLLPNAKKFSKLISMLIRHAYRNYLKGQQTGVGTDIKISVVME